MPSYFTSYMPSGIEVIRMYNRGLVLLEKHVGNAEEMK